MGIYSPLKFLHWNSLTLLGSLTISMFITTKPRIIRLPFALFSSFMCKIWSSKLIGCRDWFRSQCHSDNWKFVKLSQGPPLLKVGKFFLLCHEKERNWGWKNKSSVLSSTPALLDPNLLFWNHSCGIFHFSLFRVCRGLLHHWVP